VLAPLLRLPLVNLASLLEVAAERDPTYAETLQRVRAFAGALRARGVRPGDRVAIQAHNSAAFFEAYFAVAWSGAVLCPLGTRLAEPEIDAILADAEPVLVLRSEDELEALRQATPSNQPAHACEPGASAQLYYTSGTTGEPKGVVLTHANVNAHARAATSALELRPTDVWGHVAPMYHLADAWAIFAMTLAGGRHVYCSAFDPAEALDTFEREGVTVTNLVPTMLQRILAHPGIADFDAGQLRLVMSGGAPIAPEVIRSLINAFGCDYVQTYGLTETSPFLTLGLLTPQERALDLAQRLPLLAKTGRPFPSVELDVVREDGTSVRTDDQEVGEIRARGATVSPGYWRRPEETAAVFRDTWFYTGDLAVRDDAGFVSIVDRRKDMILSGGENVYSTEVENVLFECAGVLEAAVFGVPDPEWGEAVTAAIVARAGVQLDSAAVLAHVRTRLAGYKCPKQIVVVDDLPKTGSGKIQKAVLRQRFGRQR
jgi:fatty-acyl-CoA synthase